MEKQFTKLLLKNRGLKNHQDPFFRSFDGAIFKESAWFFHFLDQDFMLEEKGPLKMELEEKSVEVLFVGDSYKGEGEDLLLKMISAMKLSSDQFYRYPMDEKLDEVINLENNLIDPSFETVSLLNLITLKKPKIVVSMGAVITNILLGRREKLSGIHGQFLEKNIGEFRYLLVPIFHPDFLLINPNMKRTTWLDLQKIMERMGKN